MTLKNLMIYTTAGILGNILFPLGLKGLVVFALFAVIAIPRMD